MNSEYIVNTLKIRDKTATEMFGHYTSVILIGLWLVYYASSTNVAEFHLHKTLFAKYNPNVMPNENRSTPIKVTLDMYLMSIDDIDERKQTITVKAFLEIVWRDDFLTWEPSNYQGIQTINVKDTDIWIPDIALQDTFDVPTNLGQGGGKASITHDGTVTIWPYKIYTAACKIFIQNFPFDKQRCGLDFLSWTNPSHVLVLKSSQRKPDMMYFTVSGEWDLTSSEVKHTRLNYGHDQWDHVYFIFQLQRKSLFYCMNIIVPVFLISILNIICFLLPSECGERVTLSISIFLTLAVFLTVVNEFMPESSDEVALFSVYVGLQLFSSAFTIMLTIVSLNLFYKDKNNNILAVHRMLIKLCCIGIPEMNCIDNEIHIPDNRSATANNDITHMVNIDKESAPVTWKMVSRAFDRLCLISAICWHGVLTVSLLISFTT